jgi:hypothetical protein
MLFRTLFGIDALVALAFGYFFITGLDDGSVSELNIALWLVILLTIGAVLGGGVVLHYRGRNRVARRLLGVLAMPALLVGLFFLLLILVSQRWH